MVAGESWRDFVRRGRDAGLHYVAEVASFLVGTVALLGFALLSVVFLVLVVVGFTVACIREEAERLLDRLRGDT